MRSRMFGAILALVLASSTLLGQVTTTTTTTTQKVAPCPAVAKKLVCGSVVPMPKAVSKPVASKRLSAPQVVVRKSDTSFVKTIGGVDSMVVTMQFDTLNVNFSGKVELELSDEDRATMRQSQKQIFEGEGRHQRGWWSRYWGYPVGAAVVGTAIAVAGSHYHWWGGDITQCVIMGSGTCPNR